MHFSLGLVSVGTILVYTKIISHKYEIKSQNYDMNGHDNKITIWL